jgi:acetyl esterase
MNYDFTKERKPIDVALRKYLDAIAPPAPASSQPSDEDRVRTGRMLMLQARENRGAIPGLPNGVGTRDATISAGVTARLYTPADASVPLPVLVYAHGGGWVVGSIETQRSILPPVG